MELFLLKFSACLLVFWLTYVLLLEKQQMHHFKRFYLLGSFAMALIIPQLTIIEYIEPIVQNFEITTAFIPIEAEVTPQPIETSPVLTLEIILWSIYILGATLFAIRFAVNLFRLYRQIATNDKQRNRNFIYVLLKAYRIPHSFFKYIFVNQQQFENNQIPKEVRLHEETHAKQWHSLDILLLELLQIVFWFHPLVYILKHHIKLNHEFLADDAVLQQGITTKSYQNILLQFSSNTHNHQLASAINYSSFKKRFTVMKTQTSKTRIWLSTLLVLPVLAILFYSFAEREYVEKEQTENLTTEVNSFLVFVEKNGNTLELRCESGCRWSHLVLEPNSEPYIINDFGFSEGNTLDTDKFAFSIEPNQSGVLLNGLKGTAWVNLAFSLPKNQKQAVNQLGMTNEKVPNLEQISDDLQKRAEENYYKNQFFVVKDKQGRKVSKRFFELDYNNKIKWVYANEIPYHRIDVTEAHFEEAKNSKNYIIKVDGNYISKDDLKKYKASDFITFSYTPISKLAEMKEQSVLNLVTTDAYNLFVRLMISHYTEVFANYENEMALPENKRKTDIKELVSTYEFLDYNYKKFTSEILKQNQLIPPTPLSEDIIKQVHQSYLDIPNLYIDKDNNLFLNNKSTSLKTIQKDFNEITNYKKAELILKANGRRIHNDFINQIMVAIGDNLTNIEVSNGQAVIYNPNFKNKEVNQQKPVMWILVNRKGQLLVDDEVGTLESIKKKLKKLSKTKNSKGTVAIQFDSEAPEKTVNEVKSIVQKSGFEVFTIDTNQIPPPPPPPPAPEPPKKTSKGGPNANGVYQTNKIEPIEIYIDSDNNIQLNGKSIKEDAINNQVAKLNKHLSTEDHRKYVMASIAIEKNKSADLAKSIQTKLKEVNVFCGSISYLENVSKSNLPKKSLNLYSGLTVEEAKAKEKKIFSTSGDSKKKTDNTNDNSPWKVKVSTASYEYTDDNGKSTGKIDLFSDRTTQYPIINGKQIKGGDISLTKEKLKNLKITLKENKITSFKIQFPNNLIHINKGNTLNDKVKSYINHIEPNYVVTLFDIYDKNGKELPPILITVTN
ncbi:M56 family metallopeptidase [Winogradskyella marincola]|uniref:M56 family metallopeptidase n=1 Tax=Winogradskyella marincola TaxID=3037795 RepID=A0ABT6G1H4_9FLAO|nr:M56 family metallopeptidase [Winogradskyella sp. YYF002]MDG4715883.1 M56 family metallopeptidase [Winogradskyella sp. YYF002]